MSRTAPRTVLALLVVLACTPDRRVDDDGDTTPTDPDAGTEQDAGPVDAGFDCRVSGCDDGESCDTATRMCRRTCATNEECPQPGVCDSNRKICVCSPGTHACGLFCVSNSDVATCGDRCTPCPSSDNGMTSCDGVSCRLRCEAGFHACGDDCVPDESIVACGGSCTPCPTDPNGVASCAAGRCELACKPGFHSCGGVCVSDTATATCGGRCDACPTAVGGTTTCESGQCRLTCPAGDILCGDRCVPCSDPHGSASCDGNSCRLTCGSGYHLCSSGCASNGDTNRCGADCRACPTPSDPNQVASCDGGSCTVSCRAGTTYCRGGCRPSSECAWRRFEVGQTTYMLSGLRVAVGANDPVHVAFFRDYGRAAPQYRPVHVAVGEAGPGTETILGYARKYDGALAVAGATPRVAYHESGRDAVVVHDVASPPADAGTALGTFRTTNDVRTFFAPGGELVVWTSGVAASAELWAAVQSGGAWAATRVASSVIAGPHWALPRLAGQPRFVATISAANTYRLRDYRRAPDGTWTGTDLPSIGTDVPLGVGALPDGTIVALLRPSDLSSLIYWNAATGAREAAFGNIFGANSIGFAVDGEGNPHVAFALDGTVHYLSRFGSTWRSEVVERRTVVPFEPPVSLAVRPNGLPVIGLQLQNSVVVLR